MRLSHMLAAAVLVALVAAMFAALPSASAAALGACSTTEKNYLAIGDTCTIEAATDELLKHASASDKVIASLSDDGDPAGAYGDPTDTPAGDAAVFTAAGTTVTVTARALGTVTITDTNDAAGATDIDDVMIKIEVIPAPSLEVIFDDSDGTVKAGTEVQVGIRIKAVGDDDTAVAVTIKAPSGLYFLDGGADDDVDTTADNTTPLIAPLSVDGGPSMTQGFAARKLQTAGARDDTYVVTATLAADVGSLKKGDYTAELIIGDPGAGLDSVELALDTNQKNNNPIGTAVNLVATAKNAGDANANPGDVTSILVSATGGTIVFSTCGADATQREKSNFAQLVESTTTGDTLGLADTNCDGTIEAQSDPVVPTDDMGLGAVTKFSVSRSTAGTVTVQVTVIGGAAGTKASNEMVLVFAGGADAISVGEASDNLGQKGDMITFEVTATDKGGRTANVSATAITAALKDANGNTPKNLTVSDMQKFTDTNANGEKDTGEKDVATAVIVTVASDANTKAEAGHYTVEVMLNNNAKTKQTASFTVVGAAANIDVTVDMSVVELGDVITVTATITDADGNLIADDKATAPMVEFASAGALELSGFGATDGVVKKPAKDGMATAKFVATKGSGKAVILVDHGTATGTASVGTASADAMEDREPSLSHLSGTSGLVSYSGPDTTASALMALLAGRASAIWLSNNGSWVLYANVDGAMVPGSTDFAVTSGDVLYISN